MTDYKLTEDDRKFLIENVLDERWHEWTPEIKNRIIAFVDYGKCSCGKIVNYYEYSETSLHSNRTFLTPQDQKDLMRAIDNKGKWSDFYWFTREITDSGFSMIDSSKNTFWLFDHEERFAKLAADFWRSPE